MGLWEFFPPFCLSGGKLTNTLSSKLDTLKWVFLKLPKAGVEAGPSESSRVIEAFVGPSSGGKNIYT